VVHEYPESAWAYDSQEKMGKIEERIGMYKRIIESFSSWNVDERDAVREYRKKFDKNNETLKAVRRDAPKDWKK
jgi:outer membrane protein assembly factor BamD (BamD/ComL family)